MMDLKVVKVENWFLGAIKRYFVLFFLGENCECGIRKVSVHYEGVSLGE